MYESSSKSKPFVRLQSLNDAEINQYKQLDRSPPILAPEKRGRFRWIEGDGV